MKIDIEINEQDLIDFNVFHIINNEASKAAFNKQRLITTIIIGFIGSFGAMFTPSPNRILMIILTAGLAYFTYTNFFKSLAGSIAKRTKKEVASGRFNDTLKSIETTFDEVGITQGKASNKLLQKWEGVSKVFFEKNAFYIYAGDMALVYPYRFFSEDEQAELIEIINRHVNNDFIINNL